MLVSVYGDGSEVPYVPQVKHKPFAGFQSRNIDCLAVICRAREVFQGAIGGKRTFRAFEGDQSPVGGGERLVWSIAAGALAALAGVFQTVRLRVFNTSSTDMYTLCNIVFVLLLAGILIPNMRESYGEALCGLLSVPIGALSYGTIVFTMMYIGISTGIQYMVLALFGLLLLIPNLLIYKRKKDRI